MAGYGSGVVQFYGRTHASADIDLVGVALDQPAGKHNGKIEAVRYFSCGDNHGLFVKAGSKRLALAEARWRCYGPTCTHHCYSPTCRWQRRQEPFEDLRAECEERLLNLARDLDDAVDGLEGTDGGGGGGPQAGGPDWGGGRE